MAEVKRIVVLPDAQIPDHDKKLIDNMIRFVGEFQPDLLVHVGDFLDSPEPSRWNKGSAGEYAGTLQKSIDEAVSILDRVRAVYDGPFKLKMGNHDERIETYTRRYAPALAGLRALKFPDLLGLDDLEIDCERTIFDVAPGWVIAHGHEGPMRNYAGGTAIALAEKIGKSVVIGHSHRAGVISKTRGYNGRDTGRLTGMEVGHAMDMKRAHYLKSGGADWQQALGLLYVSSNAVTPSLVHVAPDRSFVVEGVRYA